MAANEQDDRTERAARLKERIYLTFAALAVVITLEQHPPAQPVEALVTLAVTSLGTLLAIVVADLLSHAVVHGRPMRAPELRHALATSFGALGALAVPFAALVGASLGWWSLPTALLVAGVALLLALVVIGFLAVRRLPMPWWMRLVALGAQAVLGLVVIGLQTLAHG